MSRRTPGPWVLQGFRIYGPPDVRSKHGNGRSLIGGVVDDGIDWRCTQLEVDGRGAFYEEAMANARLMVAAPDLLDALTALLAALEDVPVAFGVHVHDAVDAANDAIAKAVVAHPSVSGADADCTGAV